MHNQTDTRALTPEHIGRRLAPVFKRHAVSRAVLFGSVARGDASRHSDIDLLLVQKTEARFLDRYEGLLEELGEALPEAAIEPLVYTAEEMARMSANPTPFMARALREGICLYESE